jgi:hypothetical protein
MQFTTLFLAALATVAYAAPTLVEVPSEILPVEKRACPYVNPNPTSLHVTKANPQTITFYPPANAWGCAIEAVFPPGYPISSYGNAQVNVRAIGGPAPGALVGTITFASNPTEAVKTTINSFACRPEMAYIFEIAGEGNAGVSFTGVSGTAGLRMTHSC